MIATDEKFSRTVHNLVYEKLDCLKSVKPQSHEWTVVASILMEKDEELSVIVISSGTKCVGKSALSKEGLVVNDCHAEVLCRRGFIRYLIEEMKKSKTGNSNVFSFQSDTNRYILCDSIRFHMYISQSPCGYGSVFYQENSKRQAAEISNAKQRQSKRRKIDVDGQDTYENIHLSGAKFQSGDAVELSTKPGRGDPSRSYSCSDKLCLWNRIGFQGSLLRSVMDPVSISSFIIGGQWDLERMKQALLVRSSSDPTILLLRDPEECPFSEQSVLKQLSSDQKLAACGVSVVWIAPSTLEKLIPNKGIRLGTNYKKGITIKNASSLCPKRLFQSFHELVPCADCYQDAKMASTEYQSLKEELSQSFMKEWKRKERLYYTFTI